MLLDPENGGPKERTVVNALRKVADVIGYFRSGTNSVNDNCVTANLIVRKYFGIFCRLSIISEHAVARNFKIYLDVALNSLYITAEIDATSYFRPRKWTSSNT